MRLPVVATLLSSLLFGTGCVGMQPPVMYPDAPPLYYAVAYETVGSTVGGVLPRISERLAKDTKERLLIGKKVAFLPPDSCTTSSVTPSGSTQGGSRIMMECGALLASLEAEVAKAGYEVVSWQAIKTGNPVASRAQAKELDVDVLFEVNELTPVTSRSAGARQVSNLSFTREDGPGTSVPMSVSPDTSNRCQQRLVAHLATIAPPTEFLTTINLKAVDVRSGRALWLYQNSVVEVMGEVEGAAPAKLYFRADGRVRGPAKPEQPLWTTRATAHAGPSGRAPSRTPPRARLARSASRRPTPPPTRSGSPATRPP